MIHRLENRSIFAIVGHRMKTHKITPITRKRTWWNWKKGKPLEKATSSLRVLTLIMDVTLTHDHFWVHLHPQEIFGLITQTVACLSVSSVQGDHVFTPQVGPITDTRNCGRVRARKRYLCCQIHLDRYRVLHSVNLESHAVVRFRKGSMGFIANFILKTSLLFHPNLCNF